MKKLIAFVLVCTFVMALLPMTVAAYAFPEDENVAAKEYREDQIIFSQTDSPVSPSSGAANKWNKFYPGKAQGTAADPTDASNNVSYHFAGYNNGGYVYLMKTDGIPTTGEFVWESRLMIAPPQEGSYPEQIVVKLLGNTCVTFTHTTGTSYTYAVGSQGATGTINAEEWMRITAYVQCGTEGISSADTTMHLTATLSDGVTIRETMVGAAKAIKMEYGIVMPQDSIGGFYLDDVYLYIPGDFGPTTMTTDTVMDDRGNYPLDGKLTFTLYHRPDSARVDVTKLKLYNEDGQLVPASSVTWDPIRPDHIVLDFTNHPLVTNTTYTLVLPENTMDAAGQLIKENEITFRTKGASGDWRERVEIVRETEGGYVMPDPYNTGYRCDESELVDFFEKYPEFTADSEYIITEEIARKYNYEFSHFRLTQGSIKVIATSPVYVHDALMLDGGVGNGRSGRVGESSRLTIAWCEISGGSDTFGGKNLTISHCYVHDVKADHMKGNSGQIVEFNYFRDGGTRNPGAHADVVQFMGSQTEVLNDARFYGNRFDIPNLGYDHVANCCFFFKPESNTKGYSNVQAVGNWFNGGGFTTYITPAGGVYHQVKYLTYKDNKIGYGHSFGILNCNFDRESVGEDVLVYENSGYMQTLQAGSIVYYNADGERVYDISEISGNATVLVNLANYIPEARQYRIDIEVVDAAGDTVGSFSKDGEVRRYTPYKEYFTEDNQQVIGTFTDSAGTHNIVELINLPDLPHDVPETLMLSNLPLDMTDCRIEVTVTDTTSGDAVIRTGALADTVIENHRMPGVTYTEAASYGYAEGFYTSDWAGKSTADILAEGGVAWSDAQGASVTLSADGILTFTDMARDDIRLPLTGKLTTGAARLAFDFYCDATATENLKLTVGGRAVFTVSPDGMLTVGDRQMQLSDGWNTAEVVFIPTDDRGNLCTAQDAVIAHNDVYVRVTAQGTLPVTYGITEEILNTCYMKYADFATTQYLGTTGAAFGYESAGTVQLAKLAAADLTTDTDLYEITIREGGRVQTAHMPVDYADRTYPFPADVDAWMKQEADGVISLTAATAEISADATYIGARYNGVGFAGATATLGAEMTLNMKVDPKTLSFAATRLMVFADKTDLSWESAAQTDAKGYFSVSLTGIRAAHMALTMELYLVAEQEGHYYISEAAREYSLVRYIENIYAMPETTAEVKHVLSAMLGYGAAAEMHLYGTEVILTHAQESGIPIIETLPENYTSDKMTEDDKTAINCIADIGAALDESIDLILVLKSSDITSVRLTCDTWTATYPAVEGRVVLDGFNPAMILNEYTMEFLTSDGTVSVSAHFTIGNFLEARLSNAQDAALVKAIIIYMMETRAYALATR